MDMSKLKSLDVVLQSAISFAAEDGALKKAPSVSPNKQRAFSYGRH